MSIVNKVKNILEHPLVDTLARFIKKFKSSKTYWGVVSVVLVFTIREALAYKYGLAIKTCAQKQLENSNYEWIWMLLEFVFSIDGSWQLIVGGFVVFIILSLVKISEGENNTITLKESFLSILLLFSIIGIITYAISRNNTNHNKTHKNQTVIQDNLDEIKALIKLQGGDETIFLEKYFGKDYDIILKNPKTYHNFTTLLKKTKKTPDELLEERKKLLKKITSHTFDPNLQKKINKAFKELHYDSVRAMIDKYLEKNKNIEKDIIKAHYLKALSYYEEMQYSKALLEFDKIPLSIKDVNILFEKAYTYHQLGKYNEAISYYKKALKLSFSALQDYSPNTLVIYDYIGLAYYNNGNYNKALKYYKKSLKLKLLSLKNKDDTGLLENYLNIGLALHKLGKNQEAQIYYNKCFNIVNNKVFSKSEYENDKKGYVCINKIVFNDFLNFDVNFNKVIIYYFREANYWKTIVPKEEKKNLNISLKDNFNSFVCSTDEIEDMFVLDNSLTTLLLYESIATDCSRLQKYDKSIEFYKKALNIQLLLLEENHPTTATIYENIASVYLNKNKYDKALYYYNKSLNIRLSILSETHPDIAINYHFIGYTWQMKKNYQKALENYQKTINILKKDFPNGHPFINITKKNINKVRKFLE